MSTADHICGCGRVCVCTRVCVWRVRSSAQTSVCEYWRSIASACGQDDRVGMSCERGLWLRESFQLKRSSIIERRLMYSALALDYANAYRRATKTNSLHVSSGFRAKTLNSLHLRAKASKDVQTVQRRSTSSIIECASAHVRAQTRRLGGECAREHAQLQEVFERNEQSTSEQQNEKRLRAS